MTFYRFRFPISKCKYLVVTILVLNKFWITALNGMGAIALGFDENLLIQGRPVQRIDSYVYLGVSITALGINWSKFISKNIQSYGVSQVHVFSLSPLISKRILSLVLTTRR
jgi:hypothetical protein